MKIMSLNTFLILSLGSRLSIILSPVRLYSPVTLIFKVVLVVCRKEDSSLNLSAIETASFMHSEKRFSEVFFYYYCILKRIKPEAMQKLLQIHGFK